MTGVILIGGRSSRFGSDKVLATLDDRPLIERTLDNIRPVFEDIIFIGHRRKGLDAYTIHPDILPDRGPLGGIYTALSVMKTNACFVFAADMPNLNRDFIAYMKTLSDQADIIMPVWSKGREPLHAIYHRCVAEKIRYLLDHDRHKIHDLVSETPTLFVKEDEISKFDRPEVMFANINTPADLSLITTKRSRGVS